MPQVPAQAYSTGDAIDYTPSSAVVGGDVVVLNGIVGVAVNDIAATIKGSLQIDGVWKLPKTTAAWVRGLPVHWNPAGDPDNGTAGSGAANQIGLGTYCGVCVETAASGDDYGVVNLNVPFAASTNAAVTATADGLTTGLIPAAASFVTVTSAGANNQISLPAGYVGKVLRILVGTTGCELISSVAADKVNEVTVGATNELALTAEALYTCVYTKAGFWIVSGQTKLGAAQAALVPDAL
jgi:predicted RecA/RadA family phage recombinase